MGVALDSTRPRTLFYPASTPSMAGEARAALCQADSGDGATESAHFSGLIQRADEFYSFVAKSPEAVNHFASIRDKKEIQLLMRK